MKKKSIIIISVIAAVVVAVGIVLACVLTSKDTSVAVDSISLSKTELTLGLNDEQTLTVTYNPADATDKTVTWTSSAPTIASVDNAGKVKALAEGTATITATTKNGKTATCEVTVDASVIAVESISLVKTELTLEINGEETLTVTYNPTDATDKSVTWTSSAPAIASVDSTGKVKALAEGTATITATTANGKSASCAVSVVSQSIAVESISLGKTELSLQINDEETLTVTYNPTEATDKSVTWSSSAPAIASVDNTGKVKALAEGTATITATTANGKSAICAVTVNAPTVAVDSISLSSAELTLEIGGEETLTVTYNPTDATDKTVTWSSSAPAIASVDSTGKVKALTNGTATVTATTANGKSASCSVTVNVGGPTEGLSFSKVVNSSGEALYYNVSKGTGAAGKTTIVIPAEHEGLPVNIADNAFASCNWITTVIIPDSVTKIGSYAFSGCTKLTNVTLPENLNSIGKYAFNKCEGLTSITIPEKTQSIGECAFKSCTNLETVNWNATDCAVTGDDVKNNPIFQSCTKLANVNIRDGVTTIWQYTFANCSALNTISIPASVVDISTYAFNNSAYVNNNDNWDGNGLYVGDILLSVKIATTGTYTVKDGTRIIAQQAFRSCSNISMVIIADSVTHIGANAFAGNCSATRVLVGSGTQSIGYGAFGGTKLHSIYYKGTAEDWAKIDGRADVYGPTIYYYVANEADLPAEGNYWHYDAINEPEIWRR